MTQRQVWRRSLFTAIAACLVILSLDQFTKWVVLRELGPGGTRDEIDVIPGLLQFIFVRNTGSAFGLFQGSSDVLKVVSLVVIVALAAYYARAAMRDWVLALAMGLQLGGALGNVIDRFRHGYVVDFIDVPRWPTFNVADSGITVGVVLLMYALLFREPRIERELADDPNQRRIATQTPREDV